MNDTASWSSKGDWLHYSKLNHNDVIINDYTSKLEFSGFAEVTSQLDFILNLTSMDQTKSYWKGLLLT